jgi:hypothetical protein
MDATASSRWSDDTVALVLDSVWDDEWSNLLSVVPYYTFAKLDLTTDVDGRVDMDDLSTGAGATSRYWFRLLSVTSGDVMFRQTTYDAVPLVTTTGISVPYNLSNLFYFIGQQVQIIPIAQGQAITFGYNYKPASPRDLSSGADTVQWPGSPFTLAYHAGARLLLKGGAESNAAADLMRLAQLERDSFLDDVRRRTINPTVMQAPDSSRDWAGW